MLTFPKDTGNHWQSHLGIQYWRSSNCPFSAHGWGLSSPLSSVTGFSPSTASNEMWFHLCPNQYQSGLSVPYGWTVLCVNLVHHCCNMSLHVGNTPRCNNCYTLKNKKYYHTAVTEQAINMVSMFFLQNDGKISLRLSHGKISLGFSYRIIRLVFSYGKISLGFRYRKINLGFNNGKINLGSAMGRSVWGSVMGKSVWGSITSTQLK